MVGYTHTHTKILFIMYSIDGLERELASDTHRAQMRTDFLYRVFRVVAAESLERRLLHVELVHMVL